MGPVIEVISFPVVEVLVKSVCLDQIQIDSSQTVLISVLIQ